MNVLALEKPDFNHYEAPSFGSLIGQQPIKTEPAHDIHTRLELRRFDDIAIGPKLIRGLDVRVLAGELPPPENAIQGGVAVINRENPVGEAMLFEPPVCQLHAQWNILHQQDFHDIVIAQRRSPFGEARPVLPLTHQRICMIEPR